MVNKKNIVISIENSYTDHLFMFMETVIHIFLDSLINRKFKSNHKLSTVSNLNLNCLIFITAKCQVSAAHSLLELHEDTRTTLQEMKRSRDLATNAAR